MQILQSFLLLIALTSVIGCAFNFEVTTQKTALENQIMGAYRELDDDLILLSTERGDGAVKNDSAAVYARKNQQFNLDDLAELKSQCLLGETYRGEITVIHPEDRQGCKPFLAADVTLAAKLAVEENRDRSIVWLGLIERSPYLTLKDLPKVRAMYADMTIASLTKGQYFQDAKSRWVRK